MAFDLDEELTKYPEIQEALRRQPQGRKSLIGILTVAKIKGRAMGKSEEEIDQMLRDSLREASDVAKKSNARTQPTPDSPTDDDVKAGSSDEDPLLWHAW